MFTPPKPPRWKTELYLKEEAEYVEWKKQQAEITAASRSSCKPVQAEPLADSLPRLGEWEDSDIPGGWGTDTWYKISSLASVIEGKLR